MKTPKTIVGVRNGLLIATITCEGCGVVAEMPASRRLGPESQADGFHNAIANARTLLCQCELAPGFAEDA